MNEGINCPNLNAALPARTLTISAHIQPPKSAPPPLDLAQRVKVATNLSDISVFSLQENTVPSPRHRDSIDFCYAPVALP